MVMAIAAMRLQTLTRQINKANLQISLLSSQESASTNTTTQVMRKYQKLYTLLNEQNSTLSEEDRTKITEQFDNIEPLYYALNQRSSNIEVELKLLNTQLTAYTKERDEVVKLIEKQAKSETPKMTLV